MVFLQRMVVVFGDGSVDAFWCRVVVVVSLAGGWRLLSTQNKNARPQRKRLKVPMDDYSFTIMSSCWVHVTFSQPPNTRPPRTKATFLLS